MWRGVAPQGTPHPPHPHKQTENGINICSPLIKLHGAGSTTGQARAPTKNQNNWRYLFFLFTTNINFPSWNRHARVQLLAAGRIIVSISTRSSGSESYYEVGRRGMRLPGKQVGGAGVTEAPRRAPLRGGNVMNS